MPSELPPYRRQAPTGSAAAGVRHPAFRGDPVLRFVAEIQSRIETAEGTVHAFEKRLFNEPEVIRAEPGTTRSAVPQRATLPRGDVRATIESERGPALWAVYETLLGPQGRRDVAWRCHDELACRRHINQQAYIEPVGAEFREWEPASRAAAMLEPHAVVERELGRHVARALYEPLPQRPLLLLKPEDSAQVTALQDRFAAVSARALALARERLTDRVRAGGPVFPHSLLMQLLAREYDRNGKGRSFKELVNAHCPEPIAARVVPMLGNPIQLGRPYEPTTEELRTPSSLIGMFGLSLLQGNRPEEVEWSPAVLHAEQTPEYQDTLRRRALLEGTGRAWVPPPRDDGKHRHGRDLFSGTG